MKSILDKLKLKYVEAEDEAAFYGPKLDIQMKNVHGKEDTIITIQIDFALPERFDMKYTDKNGKELRPIVIHRTSIGCYERTLALLIEHYAGKFPIWLAPIQVKLLTVNDSCNKYASEVLQKLLDNGIRAELDDRAETIPKKVREAQVMYIPKMVTIGEKEVEKKTLAIRTLDGKVEFDVKVDDFVEAILEEIKGKK